MAYEKATQELYEKSYKGKGLAPAHVRQLKAAMQKAARKSKGDVKAMRAAARAYLKEKGLKLSSGGESAAKKTRSKKAPTKRTSKKTTAPEVSEDLSPAERRVYESRAFTNEGTLDLRRLSRKTLVGIAKDFGLKTLKSHSDDDVRKAIAVQMTKAPKDLDTLWQGIDPTKLEDCVGVFLDLTNVTCLSCPSQAACLKNFKANVRDNFESVRKKAPRGGDTGKKKPEVKASPKNAAKGKYQVTQKIDCFAIDKLSKKSDYYDLVNAVMDQIPETIGELSGIVLAHFEPEKNTAKAQQVLVEFVVDELIKIDLIELANKKRK